MPYIAGAIIIWNLIVALMYLIDKRNAIKHRWRIPESRLLWSAFLLGGFGAFFGMYMFRHKTKHLKFKILVPLAILANCAFLCFLYYIYKNGIGFILLV